MQLVGGRSFPLKENWYFPGCNGVRFLLVGFLVEVANKKELLWLLFDFFGRTLHASWKQKSCFVMFSPWLNDWVNERRVQTVCLWGKICMKFLHCFGAGMLFICNPHSLTFLRKSTVLPSIFLYCSNAKQILTEMISPSPRNFFSTLCSFQCSHLHGTEINGNSIFPCF